MDIQQILADLRVNRDRLDAAIFALEGARCQPRRGRPRESQQLTLARPHKRTMSSAARKRISEAMKKRWAKWKGKSAPKKSANRPAMSAAAKKKLSALMKARW